MYKVTRRDILKATAGAGAVLVARFAGVMPTRAYAESDLPDHNYGNGYVFFSSSEVAFVESAVGRLIPSDALGLGAREAGVAFFIDRQLAGSYGAAQTWYMRGPFESGTKEQGYQLDMTPAQLYRAGIEEVDQHCVQSYGKAYAQLASDEQDKVLHELEDGKIALGRVPAKDFFAFLLQNTLEGFLADPLYGGNRDFIGWKLIGFPGPRYDYTEEIERYGQKYALPPVGLLGRGGSQSG